MIQCGFFEAYRDEIQTQAQSSKKISTKTSSKFSQGREKVSEKGMRTFYSRIYRVTFMLKKFTFIFYNAMEQQKYSANFKKGV